MLLLCLELIQTPCPPNLTQPPGQNVIAPFLFICGITPSSLLVFAAPAIPLLSGPLPRPRKRPPQPALPLTTLTTLDFICKVIVRLEVPCAGNSVARVARGQLSLCSKCYSTQANSGPSSHSPFTWNNAEHPTLQPSPWARVSSQQHHVPCLMDCLTCCQMEEGEYSILQTKKVLRD